MRCKLSEVLFVAETLLPTLATSWGRCCWTETHLVMDWACWRRARPSRFTTSRHGLNSWWESGSKGFTNARLWRVHYMHFYRDPTDLRGQKNSYATQAGSLVTKVEWKLAMMATQSSVVWNRRQPSPSIPNLSLNFFLEFTMWSLQIETLILQINN